MKNFKKFFLVVSFLPLLFLGCTKLDEIPFSEVSSENFVQSHDDVLATYLRAVDQASQNLYGYIWRFNELSDEAVNMVREGDNFIGGTFTRQYLHEGKDSYGIWLAGYRDIVWINNSMNDLEHIADPESIGWSQDEIDNLIYQLRALRAFAYYQIFDMHKNILIDIRGKEAKDLFQVPPKEAFTFIENELKECIDHLGLRSDTKSGSATVMTKAMAAFTLMRLYFNAVPYIGEDKYDQAAEVARDIIGGKYGEYGLEDSWDKPFNGGNEFSKEVVWGFGSNNNGNFRSFTSIMINCLGPKMGTYLDYSNSILRNWYSLTPSKDIEGNEYTFRLGKPFAKFQKYPDDIRLQKKYKNLGPNQREGLFLWGYLTYEDGNGNLDTLRSNRGYKLYIRDQVGPFGDLPPGQIPDDLNSNIMNGDQNSGIRVVKYPMYEDGSSEVFGSAIVIFRLAEAYYTLAECEYRKGDKAAAARLFNEVRKRNYPDGSPSLYSEDGHELDDYEVLDEWMREFLFEGRRRVDLRRFDLWTKGTWWDKEPDETDRWDVYPLNSGQVTRNPNLVQNPGWE